MGWAKYYEDDIEIIYERQSAIQTRTQESEIKVVCTIIPTETNILNEVKKNPLTIQKIHYEDRYIICNDCGNKFIFSAKTQRYYDKMGWYEPKRCKCCRSFRNTRYLMCSSF